MPWKLLKDDIVILLPNSGDDPDVPLDVAREIGLELFDGEEGEILWKEKEYGKKQRKPELHKRQENLRK
ncbi:hypothetical protein FQR65_LT04321 [Abscondita terminalis]|nr:hypothetical protein FQR65_LT04321 [Abscondita terminalis]